MLPNMLFGSFRPANSRKKRSSRVNVEEIEPIDLRFQYPNISFSTNPLPKHSAKFSLRSDAPHRDRNGGIRKMANKVSTFSDLIQRVTASCLLNPVSAGRHYSGDVSQTQVGEESDEEKYKSGEEEDDDEDEVDCEDKEREKGFEVWQGAKEVEKVTEIKLLMSEVFDAVSAMKRAYVSLQEAHCPWDPDKMRVADVGVVAELRKLAVLRERFRRRVGGECGAGGRGRWTVQAATLREVVTPYEAVVEELKREVMAKEAEIENLREKLKTAASVNGGSGGKKGRSQSHQSKRKVTCSQGTPAPVLVHTPASELFEATMSSVKEASKSFTALLLSLMRSAHWDIAAAVRSIEAASFAAATPADSAIGANHAKYALESYVNRKVFQGFDHETFYMDGSLSSLLHPDQFRRDCFTQYRDMKAMDPVELLGILPTCNFGKFCSKKYLSVIHPKMEESLFGDLEQRRQLLAGNHPRNEFYGEFLGLAKAVWLVHLLAFSLDPPPSHFEASRGAEFHPQYMESVVRISGGRAGVGQVVGFPVSPGFKLANGSVIKARVYLLPRKEWNGS